MAPIDLESTLDPDAAGSGIDESTSRLHLAGRYEVGTLIGRGSSGQVHSAWDHLRAEHVAVKFIRLRTAGEWRQVRRELTALRLLELPGVVRLYDDGEEGGRTFLVMELLPGGSVRRLSGPWERWAPAARLLMENLARVHFAGVVHRDLKPANVLLDQHDRPVIVDFGLAQGETAAPTSGLREGTPRYVAPEQWAGGDCDARTDLYAVGGILWELAVGRPLPATHAEREKLSGVPRSVRNVILAMLRPASADRPRSADEVLTALGGDPLDERLLAVPDAVDAATLAQLVDDTIPTFEHLAEDAAALLLRGSRGRGAVVRSTLGSWVRSGRAVWADGKLRIGRAALSALQWEGSPGARKLVRATLAGVPTTALTLEASSRARMRGDVARALAVLDYAAEAEDRRVLVRLADLALRLGDAAALRHALFRAQRSDDPQLLTLLTGARLLDRGEAERAVQLLAKHPAPDEVEVHRLALLVRAWGRLGHTEHQKHVLEQFRVWAQGHPLRQADWLVASGNVAYGACRYAEALDRHETAAALFASWPLERMLALTNASAAALEVADFERSFSLADSARRMAARLRQPMVEARAMWLSRAALYRSARDLIPEPALIDAAAAASTLVAAQMATTEAAFAWRRGKQELAGTLALRAAAGFESLGYLEGSVLARGLAAAAGAADPLLVAKAACNVPDATIALQAVALAGGCGAHALPLVSYMRAWHLSEHTRADVLSLAECRDRLGQSPDASPVSSE